MLRSGQSAGMCPTRQTSITSSALSSSDSEAGSTRDSGALSMSVQNPAQSFWTSAGNDFCWAAVHEENGPVGGIGAPSCLKVLLNGMPAIRSSADCPPLGTDSAAFDSTTPAQATTARAARPARRSAIELLLLKHLTCHLLKVRVGRPLNLATGGGPGAEAPPKRQGTPDGSPTYLCEREKLALSTLQAFSTTVCFLAWP